MLIQFNFKNYKSFRNETSLDLSATKITEYGSHVVDIANDRVLKVAAIYGANASGKSNVYGAFDYMTYYVLNSFMFGGENDSRRRTERDDYLRVMPFMFDGSSKDAETTFEVFFVDNFDETGKTYQYGFSLLGDEVVEEWLYSKARTARNVYRTIFYRKKGEELEMNGFSKSHVENIEASLNDETLVVSLGAKLRIDKLKRVRDWFSYNEVIDFGNPGENLLLSTVVPDGFFEQREVQRNVARYFSTFDEAIKDFDVRELATDEDKDDGKRYNIDALHEMADSGSLAGIPLKMESSGTLKMFALYPSLKDVFEYGGVLFVDELNARLHPLLIRNIILTFLSPDINTRNAQLVFTTHDASLLSGSLFRRDEVWMVQKDGDGVSDLYSLVDFRDDEGNKVRSGEDILKRYLTGRYGGIPILKPLDVFAQEGEDVK